MKIIFLAPYPYDSVASQRFRFEQYFEVLNEKQILFSFYSFYTSWAYHALISADKIVILIAGILYGYLLRFYHVYRCLHFDYVFIHRELTPFGPPLFEWIIVSVLKKKVIYDFDDAIWLADDQDKHKIMIWLKWYSKVKFICKKSFRISTGNQFLRDYAAFLHNDVIINPTTINTSHTRHILVNHHRTPITIGWTGSHSTLKYLDIIRGSLQKILTINTQVNFLIICNKKPSWHINGMDFVYWDKKTEWEDLAKIHIGLMPLTNDEWAEGKCGFKILQYFSVGIPALASPVGVNKQIIRHRMNGFLCDNQEDWYTYLSILINDEKLRQTMGLAGKRLVNDQFSRDINRDNFLGLFV